MEIDKSYKLWKLLDKPGRTNYGTEFLELARDPDDPDGALAVACNGHAMVILPLVVEDDDKFPADGSAFLPLDAVKAVTGKRFTLAGDKVIVHERSGDVVFTLPDRTGCGRVPWESIREKEGDHAPTDRVRLNPALLRTVSDAMGIRPALGVTLRFRGAEGVVSMASEYSPATGYLMPMLDR